jgi:hypothetical protein
MWFARRSVDRLRWEICTQRNDGVCSVELAASSLGFFAQLTYCLNVFRYCERHGAIPDIRLTGLYVDHGRGPNWLDYYFDLVVPMTTEQLARRVTCTSKVGENGPPLGSPMSVDEGAFIVRKYLQPKPHIKKLVDDFWRALHVDRPVLGIHYRGTDKTETPRVSWQHCLTVVENYLSRHSTFAAVFAASDEQRFIDFIRNSLGDVPVYFRDDYFRSMDDRPVHTGIEGGGYEKGEDAVVNALLLAKCSTVIRTSSFLSAWASLFNPNLKVILLNKPYRHTLWYPETGILASPHTEYLPEL